ncbi:MAG: ribbon-helix-helix protein, CopG family [Pseudomonadota bacterium]
MPRTIISLEPEDKAWLDKVAKERHVPMTQVVREAIRRMREESQRESPGLDVILRETSGIWRAGDGLDYQRAMRAEWGQSK